MYRDLLIMGTRVHEGPGPSAPGHVRAYDVRTGAIRWTFHTIPKPGEPGYETWPPDAWKTAGGANAWSGISVDHARGLVFLPTGSPAWDFWGGDRHGANLFGNCVLALKAATGERVWHYQVVRHDLWDRDLPQAPVLVTVRRDGRAIDAVAQATKSGHVFVFDRETGEPLFPIEERRVPASDLKGERAVADAARAGEAAAVRAAGLHRGGRDRRLPGLARGGPRAAAPGAQRRPVRAAEHAGHDDLPGLRRRRGVGRLRVRPRDPAPLRQRERDALDPRDARAAPARRGRTARRAASTRSTARCATASTARATRSASSRRSPASRTGRRGRTWSTLLEKGKGVMPAFAFLPRVEQRGRRLARPGRGGARPLEGRGGAVGAARTRTSATTGSSTPRATRR